MRLAQEVCGDGYFFWNYLGVVRWIFDILYLKTIVGLEAVRFS